jgi:hypothetical protein
MNLINEATLRKALKETEDQIDVLTHKYMKTDMMARNFMAKQAPLLVQRSLLLAQLKNLTSVPPVDGSLSNTAAAVRDMEHPTVQSADDDTPESNSPN